ncbi:MgtC/SapB family protein [Methylobacterium sp. NEAU K]|nr:MgtC/SapB family protein [Methylobacterium sp. NEAU K]MDP4001974.1 MgtC/SapB family protein [Methylobacterium sp. NEAU K]
MAARRPTFSLAAIDAVQIHQTASRKRTCLPYGFEILAGIWLIGAGTILKQSNTVRGVTTAAAVWRSKVVGLCFGARAWHLGLAATLLALAILHYGQRKVGILERKACPGILKSNLRRIREN